MLSRKDSIDYADFTGFFKGMVVIKGLIGDRHFFKCNVNFATGFLRSTFGASLWEVHALGRIHI